MEPTLLVLLLSPAGCSHNHGVAINRDLEEARDRMNGAYDLASVNIYTESYYDECLRSCEYDFHRYPDPITFTNISSLYIWQQIDDASRSFFTHHVSVEREVAFTETALQSRGATDFVESYARLVNIMAELLSFEARIIDLFQDILMGYINGDRGAIFTAMVRIADMRVEAMRLGDLIGVIFDQISSRANELDSTMLNSLRGIGVTISESANSVAEIAHSWGARFARILGYGGPLSEYESSHNDLRRLIEGFYS